MPVKADEKYEATVTAAAFTVSEKKGTLGLGFNFETVDGSISHILYLSENTVDRFKETVAKCFGVTEDQLHDKTFIAEGASRFLKGQGCSITTKESVDQNGNVVCDKDGTPYVEVQWINPSRLGRKATGSAIDKAIALFGGTTSAPSTTSEPPPTQWNDTDVPF